MRPNRAKEKLLAGEMVVGTHLSVASPTIAEVCGLLGFDFVIIDLEHTLFDPETFADIVRASELGGATPIFRPAKNDPDLMLPYLDAGAMGVWVPGVSSGAEARRVVEAVKFHPLGSRGMSSERAARYRLGPPAGEIIEQLNRDTIVSVSIEGREGIDHLEEICAVEGVDVVGTGPFDLSQALGLPGQVDHPVVREAIADIVRRIRAAGKVAGVLSTDLAGARRNYDLGVRYTWTTVTSLLSSAGKSYVAGVRALQTGSV